MHPFASSAEQCAFRVQVADATRGRSAPADAGRAWRDLTEGRSSVLDAFTTSYCAYLVTTQEVQHAPLPLRSLHVLERVATGSYPKLVAADLQLTQSTIAGSMKQAMTSLGLSCVPSKAPFCLIALIHGARTDGPQPRLYSTVSQLLGRRCEILATPVPSLAHLLPPVVEEVLNLHVAGKTHREIALQRGTSSRTIANQLATAFERLGSSGRLNVLDLLLSRCGGGEQYHGAG